MVEKILNILIDLLKNNDTVRSIIERIVRDAIFDNLSVRKEWSGYELYYDDRRVPDAWHKPKIFKQREAERQDYLKKAEQAKDLLVELAENIEKCERGEEMPQPIEYYRKQHKKCRDDYVMYKKRANDLR